jgi:DNA-binding NarL/FixJ family response regulator
MVVKERTESMEGVTRAVIKVAIVEDRRATREGLALLIDGTEGYRCCGSYGTMEEALVGIGRSLPDVALIDIGLPGMSGIDGVRILKGKHPSVHLLMLTVYDDDTRIFDAICAGATGYLLKKTPPARLLEYIRETLEGGSPMSPQIARRVITLFRRVPPPEIAHQDLTPHEVRLLRLLVEGYRYEDVAGQLGVSINTVRSHIKHIYGKLQVHSKSEAVAKALRSGWVD